MKAVVQRVQRASVSVDGQTVSAIGRGLLTLLGDTSRGNRPSFISAEKPDLAKILYEKSLALTCK